MAVDDCCNDSAVISKQECNLLKLGQVFSGENNIREEKGINVRVVFYATENHAVCLEVKKLPSLLKQE